jgi:hypothetical protein
VGLGGRGMVKLDTDVIVVSIFVCICLMTEDEINNKILLGIK